MEKLVRNVGGRSPGVTFNYRPGRLAREGGAEDATFVITRDGTVMPEDAARTALALYPDDVAVEDIVVEAEAEDEGQTTADGGDELDGLNFEDLYALAQERDVPGRSHMSKAELQEALRSTEGG